MPHLFSIIYYRNKSRQNTKDVTLKADTDKKTRDGITQTIGNFEKPKRNIYNHQTNIENKYHGIESLEMRNKKKNHQSEIVNWYGGVKDTAMNNKKQNSQLNTSEGLENGRSESVNKCNVATDSRFDYSDNIYVNLNMRD